MFAVTLCLSFLVCKWMAVVRIPVLLGGSQELVFVLCEVRSGQWSEPFHSVPSANVRFVPGRVLAWVPKVPWAGDACFSLVAIRIRGRGEQGFSPLRCWCRSLASTHPMSAATSLQMVTNQNVFRRRQMSLRGKPTPVGNSWDRLWLIRHERR